MDYRVTDTDLTAVADAIRAKGGTSSPLEFPTGFVTAIGNITSDPWSWMGKNPTRLYQSPTSTVLFKNTGWKDWTPTTTATTLAATSVFTTQSINTADYEYWLHVQMYEEVYYDSNAVNKSLINKCCADYWCAVTRYASNYANLNTGTRNANYAVGVYTQNVMDYYNASGTRTVAFSWGYALYPGFQTPTFSNASTTTPTLNIRTPTFNARCHNSYLTTANAGCVNKDTSFYKIKYELYRIDVGTSGIRNAQDNRMDMYLHGLT